MNKNYRGAELKNWLRVSNANDQNYYFSKGFFVLFLCCIIERVFFLFFKHVLCLYSFVCFLLKYEICSFLTLFCCLNLKDDIQSILLFSFMWKCCRQLSDYLFCPYIKIRNFKQRGRVHSILKFFTSKLNKKLSLRQLVLLIRISSDIDIEKNFVKRMAFFLAFQRNLYYVSSYFSWNKTIISLVLQERYYFLNENV